MSLPTEKSYYQVSLGDSYNGVHKRQIFMSLEDASKEARRLLNGRCSQHYCIITKHTGDKEERLLIESGKEKPENQWD